MKKKKETKAERAARVRDEWVARGNKLRLLHPPPLEVYGMKLVGRGRRALRDEPFETSFVVTAADTLRLYFNTGMKESPAVAALFKELGKVLRDMQEANLL